jgi:hypothetical protein
MDPLIIRDRLSFCRKFPTRSIALTHLSSWEGTLI